MKNKAGKLKLKRKGATNVFGCELSEYLETSGQDGNQRWSLSFLIFLTMGLLWLFRVWKPRGYSLKIWILFISCACFFNLLPGSISDRPAVCLVLVNLSLYVREKGEKLSPRLEVYGEDVFYIHQIGNGFLFKFCVWVCIFTCMRVRVLVHVHICICICTCILLRGMWEKWLGKCERSS